MSKNLDEIDLKILAELQANGGLSNQELADRVGLSASPCSRRIIKLERDGIIRERVVRLEPRAIGLDLTVLIHIRMDRHTPERRRRGLPRRVRQGRPHGRSARAS